MKQRPSFTARLGGISISPRLRCLRLLSVLFIDKDNEFCPPSSPELNKRSSTSRGIFLRQRIAFTGLQNIGHRVRRQEVSLPRIVPRIAWRVLPRLRRTDPRVPHRVFKVLESNGRGAACKHSETIPLQCAHRREKSFALKF